MWVDETRMFSDTGALFEIREGDSRFEFEDIGSPMFEQIEWKAATGAVVGKVGHGIAAFDPLARKLLYHRTLEDLPSDYRMHWSGDGRWCARVHWGRSPASDEIVIFDGDDGRRICTLAPSLPHFDELELSPTEQPGVETSASLRFQLLYGSDELEADESIEVSVQDGARGFRFTLPTVDLWARAASDPPLVKASRTEAAAQQALSYRCP